MTLGARGCRCSRITDNPARIAKIYWPQFCTGERMYICRDNRWRSEMCQAYDLKTKDMKMTGPKDEYPLEGAGF